MADVRRKAEAWQGPFAGLCPLPASSKRAHLRVQEPCRELPLRYAARALVPVGLLAFQVSSIGVFLAVERLTAAI